MSLKIENFPPQKIPLVEAINKFGSSRRFAKALGVSDQVVHGWLYICKLSPPPKYCKKIEELTLGEITQDKLRPDIFGKQDESKDIPIKQILDHCIILMMRMAEKMDSENKRG